MKYSIAIFILLLSASNAFCEDTTFKSRHYTFSAGVGIMSGHTTYQIGGNYEVGGESGETRFPLSELEFPMDVYYGSLSGKVDFNKRLEVALDLKKNITTNAGKMKDKDWGQAYEQIDWWTDPDSLDIYSMSDTQIDALVADISARFYFNPWQFQTSELFFFLGGKYVYQKFDFTCSNLEQWYPSSNDYFGFDIGRDYASGNVLTYEITKQFPAVIAGTKFVTGPNLTLDVMLGYSPYVTLEDEDNHLLRTPVLVSKSECDGDAFLLSVTCDFSFSTRWSLGMRYDYTSTDTEGEEKQYLDGVYNATIEQKNFSDLHMCEMSISYRF